MSNGLLDPRINIDTPQFTFPKYMFILIKYEFQHSMSLAFGGGVLAIQAVTCSILVEFLGGIWIILRITT